MLGLLATGGMAEIYLALGGELSGFRTLVVVKRILPHLASNTDFIRMFFDEARIVAMLDHPNIVRIIEVGQDGDEYFLAMEVIQGKPLSALVRKANHENTPLTQDQCAYLIAQAANGLGYAHNLIDAAGRPLNVVHRDVSPQNILVSYDGAVKVIDFGVARALGRASETRPGGLKGKIQYMAPEQAASGRVDRRSDVFALGVVLWEAICGRRPFRRETDLETLRAVIEEPVPPPSRFVRISARLEGIVMRALEKNPADRFQTAQEMALALERYAFASHGFNPVQIGVTMKGLFAPDFARWKRTVAAAKELEGEPEEWINTSGTYLRPQGIDLKTRGSTVALNPGPAPAPAAAWAQDQVSDSLSVVSLELTLSPPPPRLGRGSIVLVGVAVLGLLALALTFFKRSGTYDFGRTVGLRPFGDARPARVEALPRSVAAAGSAPAAEPTSDAGDSVSAAAAASAGLAAATPAVPAEPAAAPLVVGETESSSPVGPATEPVEEVATGIGAAIPAPATSGPHDTPAGDVGAPPPPPRSSPSPAPPKFGPDPRPVTGRLSGGRDRTGGEPAAKSTRHRSVAAARRDPPPISRVNHGAARGKTAADAGTTAVRDRGAEASEARAGRQCSIRLGTRPWAEVWIDGRNTSRHTPYVDRIACGRHRLTFKRLDLGVIRTFAITVAPGDPLKESFSLEDD